MTKFDLDREVNLELLAAELDAALGDTFLGLSGGNGQAVVVHLDGLDLANVDTAREVVQKHKASKKTAEQKRAARIRGEIETSLNEFGLRPGDVTWDKFLALPEEKRWRLVYYLWYKIAE